MRNIRENSIMDPADDPERRNMKKVENTEIHPIVDQMEEEWPEMTKEFKRLQREQYELFCNK